MNTHQLCIVAVAIVAIAITEIFAIVYQVDGRTLALAIASVSGLAGYKLATFKK